MSLPDEHIHPHATGPAANLVKAHSKPSPNGLRFYAGWFCPFVARTWIALEEKGIDYEYVEINPYKKEGHFLEINPKGLVPAIEHNGHALYESLILNEFLEEAYPDTRPLFPKDAEKRAIARMQIDMVSKKIVPAFFKTIQSQDADSQKQARKTYTDALREFGSYVQGTEGPFVGGKEPNAVDISLAPWAVRAYIVEEHRGGPLTEAETGPVFQQWSKAVYERKSVVDTRSDREHYEEIYGRYLRNEAQSEAAKATRGGSVIP